MNKKPTYEDLLKKVAELEKQIDECSKSEQVRKKQEENLYCKENYLNVFELASVGIARVSTEGKFLEINNRFAEIVGYKKKELLNMSFQEITHPDDLHLEDKYIEQVIKGEKDTFEIEKRYIHKKGHFIWIKLFSSVKRNKAGEIMYAIASVVDISERKKTEQELIATKNKAEETETRLIQMFEHMNSGVAVYQPVDNGKNFKFIDFNKAAERITLIKRDEAIGKTLLEKFPNMDKAPLFKAFQAIHKTGKDIHLPPFYYKDDVREGWRENYIYKLPSGEIVAIFEDVTEREEYQRALFESEKKFRAIFEMAEGIMCIASLKTATFIDINPSATKVLGYTKEELTTKTFLDFIHPDDVKKTKEIVEKELQEGKTVISFQNRYRCKDGSYLWFDWNSHPVKEKQITYAIAHDITDLKKYEQELIKAKEKAEESDRLKSVFLNNMSHEIRTPMNGIIGFANLINKEGISDEKRKYYSRIIQNSSLQLLRIIDDILEISTLETKQVKVKSEEVCINDLLMEIFSVFNLKSKEINIPIYLKKGLLDKESMILTDKVKLNKIISNIVENALKYTNEGFVEFGYNLKNNNIEFYVKDTGIGIAKENLKLIFKRFSQEQKDITGGINGLGIGLSIAKENTQLLGGDIVVESEKGKGSAFYITIPYKPAKNEINKIKEKVKSGSFNKNKILIAEDEEVNFLYIETLLQVDFELNCEIIHAKNGKEAVELCNKDKEINMVFMDIKMPVMDGLKATQEIKKINKNLPIIALTAYSTEEDREKALSKGCDEFISKPIDNNRLLKILNEFLLHKTSKFNV